MRYRLTIILLIVTTFQLELAAQEFTRTVWFDNNWKFYLGKAEGAEKPGYNDSSWRTLDLPHDWSIEDLPNQGSVKLPNGKTRVISGPFDSDAISGHNTGYTVGGNGWYRKHFTLPKDTEGKVTSIMFDGIYMNADVWINGHYLGNHPNGYTAFWYDLTKYLNYGTDNVIAVKVKNEGDNSRWYSGSGIYRRVTLTIKDKLHIVPWGLFVTTTFADSSHADINIKAAISNQTSENKTVELNIDILNPESRIVASKKINTFINKSVPSKIESNLSISNPELWYIDSPNLYKAICIIKQDGKVLDKTETTFGIRTLKFDAENGFFINGKNLKLKGGALHADNGPLGAAAFDRAEERRVELMKNAGFNAIRTAHNPPSSAFLDACDRLGMLVIEEAFDVWSVGWRPNDYHVYFKDWWQRDINNMILRDRNHPSIIDWGIGNQIREARDSIGIALVHQIAGLVRSIDPSRPVSANVAMEIKNNWHDGSPLLWQEYDPIFSALDVCGYSYQSSQYVTDHERLPDRIMLSTEIDPRNCFSNWMRAVDNKFVLGNFTWTAMDYLGEVASGWYHFANRPSSLFPWHSSYTGDFDICGFRKPRSFYRDILFNTDNKLSLFVHAPISSFDGKGNSLWGWDDVKPSWTWPGFENKALTVEVYSACDSVELFLNNKSLGIKNTSRDTEFKAKWQVVYQKGTLSAVGYIKGKKTEKCKLVTAGKPCAIKLTADRQTIKADKQDLSYITVEVVDKNGIVVPSADNLINFKIVGEGSLAGVGNSNPLSLESFQQPYRKAFEGKCLVIVRSKNQSKNQIILQANSNGLKSDHIIITTL